MSNYEQFVCVIVIASKNRLDRSVLFFLVIGMTQKEFYQSRAWKRSRQSYIHKRIAIDGGMCEVCGMRLGKVVHHYLVWLDDVNCNDPSISLNENNFRYECQDCHNKEQDPRKPRARRFDFAADGSIVRRDRW